MYGPIDSLMAYVVVQHPLPLGPYAFLGVARVYLWE